jgi:hypothetical protein
MTAKRGDNLIEIAGDNLAKGKQAKAQNGSKSEDSENQHGTFFPCSW